MPTGVPLLPVTKTGAGDKQKAYIVRQNLCLKISLALLIVVGTLTTALLLTTFEVRVQRRASLHEAREHRVEEHTSHMRVLKLSILLQRHLEDEVHDERMLTQYRAWLMRAVGDYQSRVGARAAAVNCSDSLKEDLVGLGTKFDEEINRLLQGLWDEVIQEGKNAQKSLHNITHEIVAELRLEASEQDLYEQKMAEAGEVAGRFGYHEEHGADGEKQGDGRGIGRHHMWHGEEGKADEAGDGHGHGGQHGEDEEEEHDDDDEEHLANALEALLARLKQPDAVLHVSNETVGRWEELQSTSERALQDEEQEVDMERIGKRIQSEMNASGLGLAVPAYNSSEYDSELNWLQRMIHRAKLARYQKELIELITTWQQGERRIAVPLKRIEELIDEGVLEPDALLIHGDYEHYRYDGGDD